MNFIQQLNKRYACKMMDGTEVASEKVDNILESIRLAPTSLGLQPFTVLIITNKELLQKIFSEAAPGQPQIPQCSHLLVFTVYSKITPEHIDSYFRLIETKRNLPVEKLEKYKEMVVKAVLCSTDEKNHEWASRQVYIALGFALAAAAIENVDSVPIEGFNKDSLNRVLELENLNLRSVCMMAIGNRDAMKDYNGSLPKVRKSSDELFIRIN